MTTFHQNRTFDQCLDLLGPEEQEVPTIDDLYIEIEDNDDPGIVMKPTGQLVPRARSKPLPDGWVRPAIWDSNGFWRFRWSEHHSTDATEHQTDEREPE
jgi:hypothetical protein